MNNLKNYIKEGLKVNSKSKIKDTIKVKDKNQLKTEILKKIMKSNKELDLTDLDVSRLDDLSNVFDNLEYAHKIDVTGWNTSNVKSFKSMFYRLKYLQEVIGLDTWDVSNVEDMSFMFAGCTNLKNIGDLSNWEINGTRMQYAFNDCKKLKTIGNIKHWRPKEANWDIFSLSEIKPQPINRV